MTESGRTRRAPAPRIQASPETIAAIDRAHVRAQADQERRMTKVAFVDAVITVGLAHMTEVAEILDRPGGGS